MKEEAEEEVEGRGGQGWREGVLKPHRFCFFQKPTALYVQGSSYDIVILTHTHQAWVSQRDIEIRFVISNTPLTPIYSLVALRNREQPCPYSVASLMPMRAREWVCGPYLFSPESTEQHSLFFPISFSRRLTEPPAQRSPDNRTDKILMMPKLRQSICEHARMCLHRTK